jgi:acetamidase/formamidase
VTHHLPASPETCVWGAFDAGLPPVLTVPSGARVTIDTVSGGPDMLPGPGFHVPPELHAIHAAGPIRQPGHILTGPVAVEGARPGHVLQIDVETVALRQDWGYNVVRPLAGALPLDFAETRVLTIPLDAKAGTARLPWGLDLPLAPFFGVMGVAPPPAWGSISTIEPRVHGGNVDLKELVAGSTLYLPVHAEGALFSVGDGHGAQGDGEVCITAIETALRGTFRLTLRDDMDLTHPMAETPTHWITMGFHPDLDRCAEDALRRMLDLIEARAGLSRTDAYTLCSLAGDLRITQVVNGHKGVHMMLAKSLMG